MKKAFTILLILGLLQSSFAANREIELLRKEGTALFYQKKYSEAMVKFEAVTKIEPADIKTNQLFAEAFGKNLQALVLIKRAKKLNEQARFNQAMEAIEEAEKISPFLTEIRAIKQMIRDSQDSSQPLSHLRRPQIKLLKETLKSANTMLENGSNQEALSLYAKCLSLSPKYPEALEGYYEARKRHKAELYRTTLQRLLTQAQKSRSEKNYVIAIAKYKEVLKYDPGNERAREDKETLEKIVIEQRTKSEKKTLVKELLNSGKEFLRQKKFDRAIEQFEQGMDFAPNAADWKLLIKQAEQAKQRIQLSKFKKRQKELEGKFRSGLIAIRAGKFKQAIRDFEKVIIIAEKYNQIETKKQAEELLKKAKENLSRKEEEVVSQESPYFELVQTLKTLALRLYLKKKYKRAKQYFSNILELFPKNKVANDYFYQCQIELQPRLKSEIMADLMKKIEQNENIDPAETRRYVRIAFNIDKNNPQLKKYISLLKNNTVNLRKGNVSLATINGWYSKAITYSQQNKLAASKVLLQKILREDAGFLRAQTLLARVDGRLSRKIWQKSKIKMKSGSQKAYSVGLLHYNNGRIKQAAKSFRRAIKIDSRNVRAKLALQKCRSYLRS